MVYTDAVETAQRCHAGFHAVQTGMGQLVFAVRARKVNVVVTGRVDQCYALGHRVYSGKNVHVAARVFGKFSAGVHTAEVNDEGLLGDLVGLGTGEQAGGHIPQRRKSLLRPDTAHGHGSTQEYREHAGDLAGHIVLLTALDQKPKQSQQSGQNNQVQCGQHLRAPQLDQRCDTEDALQPQQDLPPFGRHGGCTACRRTAGRGSAPAAARRR